MIKITVSASKNYEILIGALLLDEVGALCSAVLKGKSVAVVSDDIVHKLYGERLEKSLTSKGFNVVRFIIKNGEASKNAGSFISLLNFLAENQLTRTDAIIALGGGVVGDLAGFAASTYMRGIGLIQIPTTLLAAVDSSVGGKTAIDLPAGKNLAGTFYQPDLVVCDTSLLQSLPEDIFLDGMAEVIKYGAIADTELLDMLKTPFRSQLEQIIARCVTIKRDVVMIDETETGPRKLLNFGHTVGHAVEACSSYGLSHGKGVAVGMAVIARASARTGFCSQDTCLQLVRLIKSLGLPVCTEYSAQQLAQAALRDKKRSGGSITLIVPESPGTCKLNEMPIEELENFIKLGLEPFGEEL